MANSFEVEKCEECPAIKRNAHLEEYKQGLCSVLGDPVHLKIVAIDCPFITGEKHSYKKQRRVGG